MFSIPGFQYLMVNLIIDRMALNLLLNNIAILASAWLRYTSRIMEIPWLAGTLQISVSLDHALQGPE